MVGRAFQRSLGHSLRAFQRRSIVISPLCGRITRHNLFITADLLFCGMSRRHPPPPLGERELIASGLSRRFISNRLLASPAPATTPGARHLRRKHDKMWVASAPQFEVRRVCVFENPHLVVLSLWARRTRNDGSRSRTRHHRSRGRTCDNRSRGRTRNHRGRSRTRNHRGRSRARDNWGRSRTRNYRGRSRTGHRTRSRTGHRTRSLAARAKSVEPHAIEAAITPPAMSSLHIGIKSGEPNDDRRQRE
jgi:hypothetical protein